MKIKNHTKIRKSGDGYAASLTIGREQQDIELDPEEVERALVEPVQSHTTSIVPVVGGFWGIPCWIFRNYLLYIEGPVADEDILRIKHFVLKKEKEFNKISKEVEVFERMTETETAKREKIPDSVKLFVWQRDEGKCIKCGNKEKLEFDHIISVVEGGSDTERNIQILCESCNRSKGKTII